MDDLDTSNPKPVPSQDIESNGEQAIRAEHPSAWNQESAPISMASIEESLSIEPAENMGFMRESQGHNEEATIFQKSTAMKVHYQPRDGEKEERSKAEDLQSRATSRQGRRPRRQRTAEAAARKLAEFGIKNSAIGSSATSRFEAGTSQARSVDIAEATKESEDQDMDTIKDSKPSATSVATNASTPGAVHVDVSSMEGQHYFQKTKGLADGGPTYYPEDDGKLASDLEQESISSKSASRHFHNDRPFGKPETTDAVGIADEKLKKVGSRWQQQENRRARIVAQTAREDKKPTIISRKEERQDNRGRRILSRTSTEHTTPLSVPHIIDGKEDDQDEDDEDVIPGAVRVAGMAATGREHERTFATRASIPTPTAQEELQGVSDGDVVTADAVDNAETIFNAEDVELDNSARHNRMVVYCSLVGAMVVIAAVSLGILLTRGDDTSSPIDRCMLPPAGFNIVVNCKCRNTTDLYIATLTEVEEEFYDYLLEMLTGQDILPGNNERNSCSPHNQAALEVASFERKGLNVTSLEAAKKSVVFDDLLQLYTIILFYIQMDGDGWEKNENWLEIYNFCDWFGVTCDRTIQIASLSLPSNGLAGTLPNEMYLFTTLFDLDLSQNEGIYGTLPAEFLSTAEKLHVLRLENLQLSGTIPEDAGRLRRLSLLSLRNNLLTGTIPGGVGRMDLSLLDLVNNKLTGSIPTELGSQFNMYSLKVAGNMLTGTLPSEMGKLDKLEKLDLSDNKFQGTVPAFLGTLPRLDTTLISKSGLSGPIPETFCQRDTLDITAIMIQANCGHGHANETDVIIPLCSCCNRGNRTLIWCDEDVFERQV